MARGMVTTSTTTTPVTSRAGIDSEREPDGEAQLRDEERGETGHERVARQHEEDVAGHAAAERHAEPGARRGVVRVEHERGREERQRRGRLAHVLERPPLVATAHQSSTANTSAITKHAARETPHPVTTDDLPVRPA